jgi:large subunit ribosomal protein L25
MAQAISLPAEARGRAGKGNARACRRAGRIPAIIYGERKEARMIAVGENALLKQLKQRGFHAHVFEIDVGGEKEKVLARDVQYHPVSGRPLHVDFLRFAATSEIDIEVEIAFLNEEKCPGVKKGGVLNVVRYSIELTCRPDAIPERLQFDLSGMDIGDAIHAEDLPLPANVRLAAGEAGETIASITQPTSERAETAAEEVAAPDAETAAKAS